MPQNRASQKPEPRDADRANPDPRAPELQAKVNKPYSRYDKPEDVVADPALSHDEKERALANLEEDARRLEESAAEGMGGGEPAGDLHEVREAREALDMPPVEFAYHVVTRDLRERLAAAAHDERPLVEHALKALEALAFPAMAEREATPDFSSPECQAEVRDEIEREKLDP